MEAATVLLAETGEMERGKRRPPNSESDDGGGSGGWTGLQANTYDAAVDTCGAFGISKAARDLGLPPSADAFEVAEEYSKGSTAEHQQPAFEGCLDGLLK